MSLYTRLLGLDLPRIPVHDFMAALGEIERGKATQGQVVAAFGLDAGEEAEAVTLAARIVTPLESISLGGFVTLTNIGATYDATVAAQGLGLVRIQTAGITAFEFGVKVSKIGTGVQSWQLFNETDGTEVAVIDDAGAAAVKNLSITATLGAPLGDAIKLLRVRAKSTVAADDPVFLGASLLIRRVERMTSLELHEVLLLASGGRAYTTEAALKTRLGV